MKIGREEEKKNITKQNPIDRRWTLFSCVFCSVVSQRNDKNQLNPSIRRKQRAIVPPSLHHHHSLALSPARSGPATTTKDPRRRLTLTQPITETGLNSTLAPRTRIESGRDPLSQLSLTLPLAFLRRLDLPRPSSDHHHLFFRRSIPRFETFHPSLSSPPTPTRLNSQPVIRFSL